MIGIVEVNGFVFMYYPALGVWHVSCRTHAFYL